jgi:hypothetical protein
VRFFGDVGLEWEEPQRGRGDARKHEHVLGDDDDKAWLNCRADAPSAAAPTPRMVQMGVDPPRSVKQAHCNMRFIQQAQKTTAWLPYLRNEPLAVPASTR